MESHTSSLVDTRHSSYSPKRFNVPILFNVDQFVVNDRWQRRRGEAMTNRNQIGKQQSAEFSQSGFSHGYFTEFNLQKGIFYGSAVLFVVIVSVIVVLEPFIPLNCDENLADKTIDFINPSYTYYPCSHIRMWRLFLLTREECDFGRRLVASVVLGAMIGWERRMADRPAGIR